MKDGYKPVSFKIEISADIITARDSAEFDGIEPFNDEDTDILSIQLAKEIDKMLRAEGMTFDNMNMVIRPRYRKDGEYRITIRSREIE